MLDIILFSEYDRIEIISHPGADRSITEQGLKTYRVFNRRYRNRRIGEFLKEKRAIRRHGPAKGGRWIILK